MIIGLFGGTFNPPHFGHLAIAQQVLDFTDCEQIWFVPGYRHTFQKPAASVEDRLEMTKLVIGNTLSVVNNNQPPTTNHGQLVVSSLEIKHKLDGNTINLLPLLPKEHTYRFIIGSDQLPTFHLWGNWQELLHQMPFLIFPRYGYPNEPLYEGMTMVNDQSLIVSNISSTKVRDRVKRGLSISEFVPTPIVEYIEQQQLYQE